MKYTPKTKEWFKERMGKRVFRDPTPCDCGLCGAIQELGFVVADEDHAEYLAQIDADYALEGCYLNYRDKQ